MDQTTRLIVGGPFQMDLGTPVGQRSGPIHCDFSLRLAPAPVVALAGLKQDSTGVQKVTQNASNLSEAIPIRHQSRKQMVIGLALGLVLGACAIGASWWLYPKSDPRQAQLSSPSALVQNQSTVSVEQVGTPYRLEETQSAATTPVPASILPIGKSNIALPGTVKTEIAASLQPTKPPLPAPPPATVPSSVILNEGSSELDATPSKKATLLKEENPAPPVKIEVATQPVRTQRLVAILPDGKSAVFSDSSTGLPVQFKVGQHLPGGGVVMRISTVQNKVITSSREYTLD